MDCTCKENDGCFDCSSCETSDDTIITEAAITDMSINKKITIDLSFFEHLLNCLANQKFIGEIPPNGDAMALEESEYRKIQRENQAVIDKAWNQGMFLLNLNTKKRLESEKLDNLYVDYWNSHSDEILKIIKEDKLEFPNDDNIEFKIIQLVTQEIRMWISLGCDTNCVVDEENCTYKVGQVAKDDFEFIIQRRGFTPKQIKLLKEILIHVGIGENLKGE